MSLYGNVKKIGSSTFQFDKIYPNRKAMDDAIKEDNIYNGRYVLVEYGERYTEQNGLKVEKDEYKQNRQIDLNTYHNVYDSTVWQKIYVTYEGESSSGVLKLHEKYIMVAELNAIVPQMELQEYDTATLIKTQNDDEELSNLYVGDDNEILHDVKNIQFNSPYFDEIQDTELNYILHMPKPMELDVNSDIDYHKEKFNIYQSYDDEQTYGANRRIGNFIGWKPVLKENQLIDAETGKAIIEDTKFSKYQLNMFLPAFGDVLGMLYDTLFGTAATNGGIRPYFANNGLYDVEQLNNIEDKTALSEYTDISKILANNSEGLAGVLSSLFADKTVPGDIRYYLSSDWLAKNTDDKTNVPGILNKPKVIFDENEKNNEIFNRHYYIDYYNWKLSNIFTDKLEIRSAEAVNSNSQNISIGYTNNTVTVTINSPLTNVTVKDQIGKWIFIDVIYTDTSYPMYETTILNSNVTSEQQNAFVLTPNGTKASIKINCDKWPAGSTINFKISTTSPTISTTSSIIIKNKA